MRCFSSSLPFFVLSFFLFFRVEENPKKLSPAHSQGRQQVISSRRPETASDSFMTWNRLFPSSLLLPSFSPAPATENKLFNFLVFEYTSLDLFWVSVCIYNKARRWTRNNRRKKTAWASRSLLFFPPFFFGSSTVDVDEEEEVHSALWMISDYRIESSNTKLLESRAKCERNERQKAINCWFVLSLFGIIIISSPRCAASKTSCTNRSSSIFYFPVFFRDVCRAYFKTHARPKK